MSVRIGDVEIEDYYIRAHEIVGGLLVLKLRVSEDIGQKLFVSLKKYKSRDVIQVVDGINPSLSGEYEVVKIGLSRDESSVIYRFDIELQRRWRY